ncbi:PREDICTED: F-box only protein 42 [Nicrophorus vespilloides]|uniref:F-box only protein 42 n=1 Tax=Nicrophorus vespilloides TaxID=110193 RepID=A0ABM1M020_NICVS|nr:PREDICTED: F-box only protein 42 [Nicrophorus vespilloides]
MEQIYKLNIDDLPDEVLELIISFLPPYKDLHECMLVCKRWRDCVLNVTRTKGRNFNRAIAEFNILWKTITPEAMAPTITKRYSHAAAIHNNSMYVFGGCACSMTTFNDLWRLDLSKRQWVRPLTMGTYPSPKACSTMVCYKDTLVLFGGWTYPSAFPLHQTWYLFNELHTYDIIENQWSSISNEVTPPPTAGHSVTIQKEWMVMYGGLQRASNAVHSIKTSDIWKLNLETLTWHKQETGIIKPPGRYGHSQTWLDDNNLLIMGGSGGPSVNYSDAWRLTLTDNLWTWVQVEMRSITEAPDNLWCNPACRVDNKIIVLSRSKESTEIPPFMYISKGVWVSREEAERSQRGQQHRIDLAHRQVDRDENVNGRRGVLKGTKKSNPVEVVVAGSSGVQNNRPEDRSIRMAAFATEKKPEEDVDKQVRQEKIKKAEEAWKKALKAKENAQRVRPRKILGLYVLDITHALDEKPYVTWLPPTDGGLNCEGPEETVLYTLLQGNSELIMFGGIQKDASSVACTTNLSNQVSNSLHFLTAPSYQF